MVYLDREIPRCSCPLKVLVWCRRSAELRQERRDGDARLDLMWASSRPKTPLTLMPKVESDGVNIAVCRILFGIVAGAA